MINSKAESSPSRRAYLTVRLALRILLVSVLTFLALELLLLGFNDLIFQRALYMFDPDLGFKVRPYAVYGNERANEFGFNERDYPHARRPETFRVLFLGDSFNWSGGQKGNYTALLERRFSEEFGEGRVEIICAGYPQTHTAEQLALLKKYGLRYNPDLVVLGFYAGNDFFDADPNRKRIVVGSVVVDVFEGRDFYTTLFQQPVVLRSRLFLFAQEKWKVYRHFGIAGFSTAASSGEDHSGSNEQTVSLSKPDYLRKLSAQMTFARFDRPQVFEQFERYVLDSLFEMKTLLQSRGIGLLVAVYPDEVQVDPELREALLQYDQRQSSDYQWDRAQSLLQQWAVENGIEFLDLLPRFREAHDQGYHLYKLRDGHWNGRGNQLAAQLLFDVLTGRVKEALE